MSPHLLGFVEYMAQQHGDHPDTIKRYLRYIDDFHQLSRQPRLEEEQRPIEQDPNQIDFGKYRGLSLYQIINMDPAYLRWLVRSRRITEYQRDLIHRMMDP